MGKIIDLSGNRYHRLTVISFNYRIGTSYYWNCRCDCGKMTSTKSNSLKNGNTKSCGCWYIDSRYLIGRTHGDSKRTKEYYSWLAMKRRCLIKNDKRYHDYGGRGIKICEQWAYNYPKFLQDMGRAPSKHHSIERINNDGNYEPNNCKWSTRKEQQNNMRSNVIIEYNGETKTLAMWCDYLKLRYGTISTRLKRGWSIVDAFNPKKLTRKGYEFGFSHGNKLK